MSQTPVTVALPYYREGMDYLASAMNSLQRQHHDAWRGVVVDDSPQGEPRIAPMVRRYGNQMHYRRNHRAHGIGAAWNACIDEVDTELFSILHTDDELEPAYLSKMTALAEAFPHASMYFCAATVVDWRGRPVFSLPDRVKDFICPPGEPVIVKGAAGIRRLMVGNYIMCPTIMYRRSKIGARRFSTLHRFVLDFRFTLGALFDGALIVGTHERLYRYRRHASQATAQLSQTGLRFQEELSLFRDVERKARDLGWSDVARWARMRPTFRIQAGLFGGNPT